MRASFAQFPRPAALLLDMDGTLTVARLDFPVIKREIGIGERPILEAMAEMTPEAQREAMRIVERHENEAARASELAPGAVELFDWVARARVPMAIVTRNSGRCLAVTGAKHSFPPCVCIAREDAPHKPDPRALLLACERLGVPPEKAWMVGDGRFDIEAARAANMFSVWITRGRVVRPFDAEPDATAEDLCALLDLLRAATAVPRLGPESVSTT